MRFRSNFPTREKEILLYYIHMLNYSTGLMLILNSFLTFILWIKNQSIIFNGNIYWEVMKGHYLKMYPEKIPRKKCTFHQTNLFTIVSNYIII